MELSLPSITPEIRAALAASGGAPIQVQDPETLQVYVVSQQPIEMTLDEDYINRELEKGLADIDAGRVAPWDVEAFLAKAHRRYAEENR